VETMEDGSLKIKVTAPPEKGKANEEVLRVLAEYLGVGRKCVEMVRGSKGREKFIKVLGISSLSIAQENQTPSGSTHGR